MVALNERPGTLPSTAPRALSEALPSRAVVLQRSCDALAALVRSEFPGDLSLAEIASTWGNATEEQIVALQLLEDELPDVR